MAVRLLSHEVSELCLGKPALRSLSVSETSIGDALCALKRSSESFLSVWNCFCRRKPVQGQDKTSSAAVQGCNNNEEEKEKSCCCECVCVGKICLVDIICFLAKEENLKNPIDALENPISVLLPNKSQQQEQRLVVHLEPHASVVDAIDVILEGAQNLVIPLKTRNSTRKKLIHSNSIPSTFHNNRKYCWLAQEDIIRFLLNSIGLFSPTSIQPINSLDLIDTDNILSVHYDDPALAALPSIHQALINQISVAIIDVDGKIFGEISPYILNHCDESVAAVIATLSAGDLMAYIDCGGPPEDLVQLVKERLERKNLAAALELMEEESSISSSSSLYSSSDEESGSISGRSGRSGGYSARVVRRSEAIVCYPWSSLVAVMIQALSHRVSYVWVVEEDGTLVGIVTFARMLKVFRESIKDMIF